jgi:hypothetical protein
MTDETKIPEIKKPNIIKSDLSPDFLKRALDQIENGKDLDPETHHIISQQHKIFKNSNVYKKYMRKHKKKTGNKSKPKIKQGSKPKIRLIKRANDEQLPLLKKKEIPINDKYLNYTPTNMSQIFDNDKFFIIVCYGSPASGKTYLSEYITNYLLIKSGYKFVRVFSQTSSMNDSFDFIPDQWKSRYSSGNTIDYLGKLEALGNKKKY